MGQTAPKVEQTATLPTKRSLLLLRLHQGGVSYWGQMKAWAIVQRKRIMVTDRSLEIYYRKNDAQDALNFIRPLVWVKGKPKIVRVEIKVIPR
jgi:hypothetical protein